MYSEGMALSQQYHINQSINQSINENQLVYSSLYPTHTTYSLTFNSSPSVKPPNSLRLEPEDRGPIS